LHTILHRTDLIVFPLTLQRGKTIRSVLCNIVCNTQMYITNSFEDVMKMKVGQ